MGRSPVPQYPNMCIYLIFFNLYSSIEVLLYVCFWEFHIFVKKVGGCSNIR